MLRAAAFSLLTVSLLAGSLAGQRAGATLHGGVPGMAVRSGSSGPRFSSGPFGRRAFSHRGLRRERSSTFLGSYWFPYDETDGYEESYVDAGPNEPRVVVVESAMPERAPVAPKVIEVPASANPVSMNRVSTNRAAVTPPAAVFVFKNGERLEAQRFLLRTGNLSVSVNREQRDIPLDMLDIDATVAANRERGIDLRIPTDPNEISLSF